MVGGGGGTTAQPHYDAHFGVSTTAPFNVRARFVNGREISAAVCASLGNILFSSLAPGGTIVVVDAPALATLAVSPSTGKLGIGQAVTITVTAASGEDGLVPAPSSCCFVNGVNVSSSFVALGGGVYTVRYVVGRGDGDVVNAPPSVQLQLMDPATQAVTCNAGGPSLFTGTTAPFVLDGHPPVVSLPPAYG